MSAPGRGGRAPAPRGAAGAVNDPLPGRSDFVWLLWDGAPDALRNLGDGWHEVTLAKLPSGQVVAGVDGTVRGGVRPAGEQDRERLARAISNRARIAVLSTRKVEDEGQRRRLRIGLDLYTYEQANPLEPQSVGVGDRVMDTVGKWDRKLRDRPDEIIRWLAERLLIPSRAGAGPEAPHRLVVSIGLSDPSAPAGYRIHGRGVTGDVRTEGDRLVLHRLRRTGGEDGQGRLRLTECRLAFTDVSRASELRAEMKHQLNRLATGQGFLAMWHEYNRLETRFVRRQVRDIGFGRYTGREPLGDGVYRFRLDGSSHVDDQELTLAERARRALDARETLELEAAQTLPAALAAADEEDDSAWALIGDRLGRDVVSGTVVAADVAAGTIDLRLVDLGRRRVSGVGRDRTVAPPPQGFLYRSFRGDRRQMQRRKDAFDRILADGTRIPNLLALFEGKTVSADPPGRRTRPISDAVRDCFRGGEPTPMQERALEVALNTPDIAVIQGPPGTGKTQVITALQTRLAEEGRGYARLRGSILLTSFQHAAVDELVERSRVFGLPANKVDRAGRGTTVQTDRWLQETVDWLTEEINADSFGRALGLLRTVTARAAAYLLTPTPPEETARLLEEIEELAGDLLPADLADRLHRTRLRARTASRPVPFDLDDDRELTIRALRGVRTLAESFADDGPAAAAKALRRVRALDGRDAERAADLDLLARAASWDVDEPVPFLAELAEARDRLLEALRPASGPLAPAAADPEVEDLLAEIAEDLEERVRDSGESGPQLAMLDYLEGLRGDPAAVEWTLRAYTASYAATCQQAASPTVAGAKQEARIEDVVFDTVIIDEAARANPLDLMIPLIHAGRRIVLVGDHNQLPHMLEPEVERQVERLDAGARGRLRESLFQRLFENLGAPGAPVDRVVTLNAQFRMHRTLGEFVSRCFYGGILESPRPDAEFAHALPGYEGVHAAWIDVPNSRGAESGKRSKRRRAEARAVADQLERLLPAAPDLTFGVISFYSDQVDEIWRELAARELARRTDQGYEPTKGLQYDAGGRRLDRLHVGSVDAFQGKEFDVVFLSTTRSSPPADPPDAGTAAHDRWVRRRYGHLTLRNRLCVAMSRQKRLLVTVGDSAMFEGAAAPAQVEPLTEFLRLCRSGGGHGAVLSP
ncbi:AAA domain-containing protein [Actinomadura sp. NPDC000929]|uniref:DEAD/DEAH box helicase n=1 Tax=Actinomadura sp. NPDC000929 TaxID=3154517 RepID=UPI00339B8A74